MATPTESPSPKTKPKSERKFKRKSDFELYDLDIHSPNPLNGRTHKATNEKHTWEGTEEQFLKAFTHADGTSLAPSAPVDEEEALT